MAKLFVVCGHGAGDPGACGNGYQEAERVRTLAARIKSLGGDNVILGDVNRNWYKDNGISYLDIPKDYQIIELHMDSASSTARGAHVIIDAKTNADAYDIDLSKRLSRLFPGRSKVIVKRNDLANPARAYAMGYSYRLVEIGFISNAEDVAIFNANIDNIAKDILACFGIGASVEVTPDPETKCDQVLYPGEHFVFNGVFKVESMKQIDGAWCCLNSRIGGYVGCGPLTKCDSNGNTTSDQTLYTNDYFKIKGTFTVQDATNTTILVKELGYWVNAEPLTEVK